MGTQPDRNIALELVRATEAAALAAARWVGCGEKEAGDQAAVQTWYKQLISHPKGCLVCYTGMGFIRCTASSFPG